MKLKLTTAICTLMLATGTASASRTCVRETTEIVSAIDTERATFVYETAREARTEPIFRICGSRGSNAADDSGERRPFSMNRNMFPMVRTLLMPAIGVVMPVIPAIAVARSVVPAVGSPRPLAGGAMSAIRTMVPGAGLLPGGGTGILPGGGAGILPVPPVLNLRPALAPVVLVPPVLNLRPAVAPVVSIAR